MSTRAYISVRINDEDLGKTMRIDISKFGINENDLNNQATNSLDSLSSNPKIVDQKAQEVVLSDRYITVCHHSDGYPEGLGRTLLHKYRDYNKALNLLLGGDISCAVCTDSPVYFLTRDKWEDCKPRFSPHAAMPGGDREYAYVFENGDWMMYAIDGDQDPLCNRV